MSRTNRSAIARHLIVRGRVQGVFYRASTRDEARRRAVAGWVRNLDDGAVEAWLEGDAEAVDALIAWMRRGPARARVTDLDINEATVFGYTDFEIA